VTDVFSLGKVMRLSRSRRIAILAGVLGALGAVPAAATAGGLGRWEALNAPNNDSSNQVGLVRHPGTGSLHVAWSQPGGATADVLHRAIAPRGRLGPVSPIAAGYAGAGHPALLVEGGGLRALFGGSRSVVTSDPLRGILTATSADHGVSWTEKAVTTPPGAPSGTHAGMAAAITMPSGTPLTFSSGSGFGIVSHLGLNPATPLGYWGEAFDPNGCCTINANAVRDGGNGVPVAVYASLVSGRQGVYAQRIDPASGGPAGPPAPFPGVGEAGGGPPIAPSLYRMQVATRPGGGVFVVVAGDFTEQKVLLWRVGAARATLLASTRNRSPYIATVAGTPDGRIWAVWSEEGPGGLNLVARRSNPSVSRFGERQVIRAPRGVQRLYRLESSAGPLRLDVIANAGDATSVTFQHTQLLPPLTLSAKPGRLRGRRLVRVRFRVTDVGVPVPGVTVSAQGKSATTGPGGRASLQLRGPGGGGKIPVTARKSDYRSDRLRLTVVAAPGRR
jgi:hypothetical protein